MLAGMKIGWNMEIGLNRYLASWENANDPSCGAFTYSLNVSGIPQLVLRKGSGKLLRSGLWNGVQFCGILLRRNLIYVPKFILNSREAYYEYNLHNQSTLTMLRLSYSGALQRLVWNNRSLEWRVINSLPCDRCDNYNQCGPNAFCSVSDHNSCKCLNGYRPKSPQDWDMLIRSSGCIRRDPLNSTSAEGFIELVGMKMPDLLRFWKNTSMTLGKCRIEC